MYYDYNDTNIYEFIILFNIHSQGYVLMDQLKIEYLK